MKNKALWISLALMATLPLLLLVVGVSREMFSNTSTPQLTYFIDHPTGISLDPLESDFTPNAILMKHLVGTLVRYKSGGQFEPYLADRFEASNRGTTYAFHLRSGLKCENGEPIDAQGYIAGFLSLARIYSQNGPIPMLSDLIGWDEFVRGGPLKGVGASGAGELTFQFQKPVSAGFLEYLSMPYYGYFCSQNFKHGKWNTNASIVSSGPYALSGLAADGSSAQLTLRSDWPLNPPAAPKTVKYLGQIPPEAWQTRGSVIQKGLGWGDADPANYRRVLGPPDLIRSFALDDGPTRFFAEIKARRQFQAKVYEVRESLPFRSKSATLANSFYPSGPGHKTLSPVSTSIGGNMPNSVLSVFAPAGDSDETQYMIALAEKALRALGWDYRIVRPNSENGFSNMDLKSRGKFDMRITSVVAGSVMEPWVVEMMFCSSLGVSFSDPAGQICKAVREMLRSDQLVDVSLGGHEISRLVHESAAVVPVYHGRTSWYFSNDLDVSRISGDLILPSFEDIGVTR